MGSRSNITMVKMKNTLTTCACLVIFCLVSSARGQDIEDYDCPPDKPFMCSKYGSCFGFQEYCNVRAKTVESCFKSNDEDSIRKECTSRQFPIDRACRYACRNRYPELQPYPDYVELSKVCDHDRQSISFQAICKGKQTVSCFPENMISREDKHAFCRSEEGRNLSSQLQFACIYACEDAFPEFSENPKPHFETSTTSKEMDHRMTTTTTTAAATTTTTQQTTTSDDTEANDGVNNGPNTLEDPCKDKRAPESNSCVKESIIAVVSTCLCLIIAQWLYIRRKALYLFCCGSRSELNENVSDGRIRRDGIRETYISIPNQFPGQDPVSPAGKMGDVNKQHQRPRNAKGDDDKVVEIPETTSETDNRTLD